ncbi:MAG: hypothetical protein NVSMB49_11190 [Ktedonobacteraceae bacterium]
MAIHILVIRPGAIGDTLLTFPLLHALKTQNSGVHITFVSNPTILPLAQKFGLADAVFDYGALEWSELFSQFGIRSSFMQDILHRIDRAICWVRDPDNIVEKNVRAAGVADVTVVPGRPTEASGMHVVNYLAQTIGLMLPKQSLLYSLAPGLVTNAQGVAIHPGSGGASKCWPVARFAEIIMALWQRHIPILLLAGPADTERLSVLMQRILLPPAPSLLKLVVDAPLVEVTEHLQHYKGYLGNDSGITHLAALLGLPTVVLFGPSSPALWMPVGPNVHVLHEPNLENLSVEVVLDILTWLYRLS